MLCKCFQAIKVSPASASLQDSKITNEYHNQYQGPWRRHKGSAELTLGPHILEFIDFRKTQLDQVSDLHHQTSSWTTREESGSYRSLLRRSCCTNWMISGIESLLWSLSLLLRLNPSSPAMNSLWVKSIVKHYRLQCKRSIRELDCQGIMEFSLLTYTIKSFQLHLEWLPVAQHLVRLTHLLQEHWQRAP